MIYFIILIRKNLSLNKTNYNLNLFILFFSVLIIIQPILQGLDVSGKNIIRLCTLAYPGILIFFIINSKKFKIKKIVFSFFIILTLIWSSHPTFSIFSYLEKFKF